AADVLLDLHLDLAVGEPADERLAQAHAELAAHGLGQGAVCVPAEYQEVAIGVHGGCWLCNLAGAAGFEPADAGIKTRCLGPLGDAPLDVRPAPAGQEPGNPVLRAHPAAASAAHRPPPGERAPSAPAPALLRPPPGWRIRRSSRYRTRSGGACRSAPGPRRRRPPPVRARAAPARRHSRAAGPKRSPLLSRAPRHASIQGSGTVPRSGPARPGRPANTTPAAAGVAPAVPPPLRPR